MKKTLSAGLLALTLWVALANGTTASAATRITVDGDFIRIGDLFDVTGQAAEKAVAYAPAPGQQITVAASWVARLARVHGIDWRPVTGIQSVTIERSGQAIDSNLILSALKTALEAQAGDEGQVDLFSQNLRLYIAADAPPTFEIEDLIYDRRSRRFSAAIATGGNDRSRQRLKVSGVYVEVTRLPVVRRNLAANEIIGKGDISWIDVKSSRVAHNIITDEDQLIGMASRRPLRTGTAIRIDQIGPPLLVERKSRVNIEMTTPYMTLTATGRAIDEGGIGDTVRVVNVNSGATVDSVVIGQGRVAVRPFPRLVSN